MSDRKRKTQDSSDEDDDDFDESKSEDDDDDLDEEDSEEEEETYHKSKKKKKRPRHGGFILEEAEVDDDEEEDEDIEAEEGYKELEKEVSRKERIEDSGLTARDYESHRRLAHLMDGEDEAAIEKYYRDKYATESRDTDEARASSEIKQQALRPSVSDPSLWRVKCRIGEETATILQLMRKFIAHHNTPGAEDLNIISAVVPSGVKGVIYIESFRQQHVLEAIQAIGNFRVGRLTADKVPKHEMEAVMHVTATGPSLKANQWVRLKRGVYRDDLARVISVDNTQNYALLKLVPRIDYQRLIDMRDGGKKIKYMRPSAALFTAEKPQKFGFEVRRDHDGYVFRGDSFDSKGFLTKYFRVKALVVDGVRPTLTELEKFHVGTDEAVTGMHRALEEEEEMLRRFQPGDTVEVKEGSLAGLKAQIMHINRDKVVVKPDHEDLTDLIQFESHQLRKSFKVGNHVRVIRGKYQGSTGLVVRITADDVVLFCDTTFHEMRVRANDLQLSSERTLGFDQMGQYQFGDLVRLDPTTVGVIVKIERDLVHVLNMFNRMVQVKPQSLLGMIDSRRAITLDCSDNSIRRGCLVNIVDADPKIGNQAREVKHIFRKFVFLHSKIYPENGGLMACPSRNVKVLGVENENAPASNGYQFAPASPGQQMQRQNPRTSYERLTSGPPKATQVRDDAMIGKHVRITKGPYKAQFGIVRDATGDVARVELHTCNKTVGVDRQYVKFLDPSLGPAETQALFSAGANTFMTFNKSAATTPDRTPDQGNKTPAYLRTPGPEAMGGMTPGYEGGGGDRTPGYHMGSRTPHYAGGRTPAYNNDLGKSPAYAGDVDDWDTDEMDTPGPTSVGLPETPIGFDMAKTPGDLSNIGVAESPYTPQNPATPGMFQDTDSVPPVTPGTLHEPGSVRNVQPFTPGTPVQAPITPNILNHSPMASNTQPHTPGIYDTQYADWVSENLEVIITRPDDQAYANKLAQVRSVTGQICSLFVPDLQKVVTVLVNQVEPLRPRAKNEHVKILEGEHRDMVCEVVSYDNPDCVLKIHGTEHVLLLPISKLCRVSK